MMAQEDNFGYSLPLPELTNEDAAQALRETISASKKYTFFHLLQSIAVPYAAEKCYGKFSEPLDSTIYSGMILLEILAIGGCLHSAYTWRKASRYVSELEQMVGAESEK